MKRCLLIVLFLCSELWSQSLPIGGIPVASAVTPVSLGTPSPSVNGAACSSCTSLTWNHTIGAGVTNGFIYVAAMLSLNPDTGCTMSATYNGSSMTGSTVIHGGAATQGITQLFTKATGSTTGAHNVVLTVSGCTANVLWGGSVSLANVNQSTPTQNTTTATGNNTTPAVTVTSATNHLVIDTLDSDTVSSSNQTLRATGAVKPACAPCNGATSTAAGASSVAMGYTTTSGFWGMVGMDVINTGSAVALDAIGPNGSPISGISCNSCTSLTWSQSCAGPNGAVVVGAGLGPVSSDAGLTMSSTFNSVSLTSLGTAHSNANTAGFAQMWSGTCSGTHNVVITESGGTPLSISAWSADFANVNQTTPTAHFNSATGDCTMSVCPALTVTSATNDLVMDTLVNGSPITSSGQTIRFKANYDEGSAAGNVAGSTATGAASVSMSYTTTADWWALLGIDIQHL